MNQATKDKIFKSLDTAEAMADAVKEQCFKTRQLLTEGDVSTSPKQQQLDSLAAAAVAKRQKFIAKKSIQ